MQVELASSRQRPAKATARAVMRAAWRKFSKDFDKTTAGWAKDQVAHYVDHIYDDLAMIRDESPRLLRYAQCMIVYGTFENSVVRICHLLNRAGRIGATPPRRMYAHHAREYLHTHVMPWPEDDWQWLDGFRVIRNWMAHGSGRVPPSYDRDWALARAFARHNRGAITIPKLGTIVVKDGLVDRAFEKVSGVLTKIHDAVQEPPVRRPAARKRMLVR